ncbi:MAG: SH3 domain-containing protein [Chloroflexi bacterium]|nr:SH3 domain-containing protein [Chloroflexota bacterium]
MRGLRGITTGLVVALLLPLAIPTGYAQGPDTPLVGFVVDSLNTAVPGDVGPDGITKLEVMFQDLGARTTTITLDEPIPADVQVVVIVTPRRKISTPQLARLWVHMQRGHHVLLALDPVRHNGTNSEDQRSGAVRLFGQAFGLSLADTFLAEAWFDRESARELGTSYSQVYPDIIVHPVIAPLITYELPVQVWGARSLAVEPFGVDSEATPLLRVRTAFGETSRFLENRDPPELVELTPEEDVTGLLNVAALAEDTATGSRLVMLGDSEIFQNDYGLNYAPGSLDPLFPGDWILAQRIAAWLLELPEDEWLPLPSGYTWLAVDGDASDWADLAATTPDEPGDVGAAPYDIQQVQAFRDRDYLYLLFDTAGIPGEDLLLTIQFDSNSNGNTDATLIVERIAGAIAPILVGGPDGQLPVPAAGFAVGDRLELRVPLRIAGTSGQVPELCLGDGAVADCLNQPLEIAAVNTRAPADVLYFDGPLVTINTTSRVNLRGGPGTSYPVLDSYGNGQVLAAVGRNVAGDWIQVQNAAHTGWIASFLLFGNTDLMALPVAAP